MSTSASTTASAATSAGNSAGTSAAGDSLGVGPATAARADGAVLAVDAVDATTPLANTGGDAQRLVLLALLLLAAGTGLVLSTVRRPVAARRRH